MQTQLKYLCYMQTMFIDFIVFFIHRFKYPSILIFFQDIDIIIISSIVILQTCDRDGLYCSSVSLLETLNNPTPFCQYGGK